MQKSLLKSYLLKVISERVVEFDGDLYDIDDNNVDDILQQVKSYLRTGADSYESSVNALVGQEDENYLVNLDGKEKEAFEILSKVSQGMSSSERYELIKNQSDAGIPLRQSSTDPSAMADQLNANWSDARWLQVRGAGEGTKKIGKGEPVLAIAFDADIGPGEPDFRSSDGSIKFSVKAFDGKSQSARSASGREETSAVRDLKSEITNQLNFEWDDVTTAASITGNVLYKRLQQRWESLPETCPEEIDWSALIEKLDVVVDATTSMNDSLGIMGYDGNWSFYANGESARTGLNFFSIDLSSNRMGFTPISSGKNSASNFRELLKPGGLVDTMWKATCIQEEINRGAILEESKNRKIQKIIYEELTRSDKKEIDKMIAKRIEADRTEQRKQFKKNLAEEIKSSKFQKMVLELARDEMGKELKGKQLQAAVVEVTKKVIKKMYRELSYAYNPVIDRIKL